MNEKKSLAITLLAAGALFCGCGTKQMVRSENSETPSVRANTSSTKSEPFQYTVKKRDTLWAIAAKSDVYGDPFEWPLLYKQNRDKIGDPDLIYPKQKFKYEQKLTGKEKETAKKLASETPKYDPHDKPRTRLPMDYF